MGHNLQDTAFYRERRNCLAYFFGLFGFLPLIQPFKYLIKKPYFFLAHLHGKYIPRNTNEVYMKTDLFKILNNRMFREGKIIKYRYIPAENKTSWLYVFDSYKSYKEWGTEIEKLQIFSHKKLPSHLKHFKKEGFLNPIEFFLV